MFGVEVDGAARLRAALRAGAGELADLTDANRKAAQIIRDAGRGAAPRDHGDTIASVRVDVSKTQAVVLAGGPALPYVPVDHWGWRARHIAPNPWLSIAAQTSEPRWTKAYEDHVADVVDTIGEST